MSSSNESVSVILARDVAFTLKNVGVICPKCGNGHCLGDITIKGACSMPFETYADHNKDLIHPKLSALLPIDPQTYDIPDMAVSVNCYVCNSKMVMMPHHLCAAAEAFNSWKMFVSGSYYIQQEDFTMLTHARRLYFSDINFLLTALLDRVEFENISLDPIPDGACDAKGVPLVYEFDVSANKDQSFSMLSELQIVRHSSGHFGYVAFSPEFEDTIKTRRDSANATERFLNALSVLTELLQDWYEFDEFDAKHISTDPFREFYRNAFKSLHENSVTAAQSYNWFKDGNDEFPYPAMTEPT